MGQEIFLVMRDGVGMRQEKNHAGWGLKTHHLASPRPIAIPIVSYNITTTFDMGERGDTKLKAKALVSFVMWPNGAKLVEAAVRCLNTTFESPSNMTS